MKKILENKLGIHYTNYGSKTLRIEENTYVLLINVYKKNGKYVVVCRFNYNKGDFSVKSITYSGQSYEVLFDVIKILKKRLKLI